MSHRSQLHPVELREVDPFALVRSGLDSGLNRTFAPLVDIWEERDRLVFKADLPGFQQDDVTLSVEGNVLRLCGKRLRERMDDDVAAARHPKFTPQASRSCRSRIRRWL